MIINDAKELCSYQNWYHNFNNLADESVIIEIPEDVLAYLHADGIVLPREAVPDNVTKVSREGENVSDWDESESDAEEIIQPAFPHFSAQVSDALRKLGGSAFVKLNWSAPFDAAWIMPDKTLRCTTLQDIYLLLKSSERIDSDLSYEFKGAQPNNRYILVLKRWRDIDPGTEYRCFVYQHQLIAISQRDLQRAYAYITDAKFDIIENIKKFYNEKVKDKIQLADYVFDVSWKKRNEVCIIDVGPLNYSTNLLLFKWEELVKLADLSTTSVSLPEFRYLGENPGHQPVYHGVPLDFNPQFISQHSSVLSGMTGYMDLADNVANWNS